MVINDDFYLTFFFYVNKTSSDTQVLTEEHQTVQQEKTNRDD